MTKSDIFIHRRYDHIDSIESGEMMNGNGLKYAELARKMR